MAKTSAARTVAVIGGGWAGCAAGVELARQGVSVTLFESARTLGGRARQVEVNGRMLDNGQHILLGAYRESLRLMREVGIDSGRALLRLPLQMRYPKDIGMDFVAPRLPAPLHVLVALLRAKGLDKDDKLALARFSSSARWMDWTLNTDCTVAELLERFDQTDRLVRLMWRPLCIAALNTPPERASAQVFLNVLRDSLGARRAASDMLLPRVDLSALFPLCAARHIKQHGGTVLTATAVQSIHCDGSDWRVEVSNGAGDASSVFNALIIATQPAQAVALLDGIADTSAISALAYEPITTCYLQYPSSVRLDQAFYALTDDPSAGKWGQFVFDRGQLDATQAGLLSVVVSASTDAITNGHEALAIAVVRQLAETFGDAALASPEWTKVISEKRATFSCTPDLARPSNETGIEGLFLAGDYTASDYPATLESAVRSAVNAARLALY